MTEIINLLARNLAAISNERNELERLAAVQELWALHGVLMVDDGTYVGHSEIEARIRGAESQCAHSLVRKKKGGISVTITVYGGAE